MNYLPIGIGIGVAVVVVITMLLVLRPLLKARGTDEVRFSPWVLMLVFPVAVFFIYSQVTTYPWGQPAIAALASAPGNQPGASAPLQPEQPNAAAIEEMVAGLAERLQTEPDDLEGWAMLGRSYMQLKRYQESADAWREAWRLSDGERIDIAVDFAEALIMSDPKTLTDGAGELLDIALEEQPANSKALWYGGLSAAARSQPELAERRWTQLLEAPSLPANIRQLVQQQLAAMGADVPTALPEPGGPKLNITIELSPELASQVQPGQSLFVFARDAEGARPPVAVKRLVVGEFPMRTTLRDTDVMVPGMKLTGMQNLRVAARISTSGNAMEAPGDLFGEAFPDTLTNVSQKVVLTIDKVVQ
jgi:cytochrome c-type biogenesis protein CcmH